MILRGIVYVVATFFLLSHSWTAAGEQFRKKESEYAVKTIQTEDGDMYDCVDFYKQPAFNHPLLKSHDFHPEMRPTSRPERFNNEIDSSMMNDIPLDKILLKDGGCPRGTVPIRRINDKADRLQTEVLPHQFAEEMNPNKDPVSGVVFSVGQTKSDPAKKYYGVGGNLSVYDPPNIFPNQYSSVEVILKGGSDVIIAGLTVNPSKYGDTKTRIFIYSVAGAMHCFNSECGFIIVNTDLPLGATIQPVSVVGKESYVYPVFIYQDPKNGNWWLELGLKQLIIGFWPQKIFQGLQYSATYAACGGEVYTPPTLPPPQMGAGYPAIMPDLLNTAHCSNFVVVDDSHNTVDPDSEMFLTSHDYGGQDVHDDPKEHKHIVYFGGP